MRPLRVRALMRTPIAIPGSRDIHLDALLAWVWVLRHHPDRIAQISRLSTRDEILNIHLPVAVVAIGNHRVPVCAAWEFPLEARLSTTQWTRRKDGEDIAQRARKVSASSPERPQLNRGDVIETPWAEWLTWGSRREVRKALDLVHSVGGLRGHGYGTVASWEVEIAEHDPQRCWIEEGRAVRNLPASAITAARSALVSVSVQPPYWLPCMHTPGVVPGVDASLNAVGESAISSVDR